MVDKLRKVRHGDPMQIGADEFNLIKDTVQKDVMGNLVPVGGAIQFPDNSITWARVRNDTGAALPRYSVVAFTNIVVGPAANLATFQRHHIFAGTTPGAATPVGQWGVLLDPLTPGGIGRVAVSGVVPVQVDATLTIQSHVETVNGVTATVSPNASGSARVLWIEASGNPRWALVRLGDHGGGAGAITLREEDGTPANSVDTIEIHQDHGLEISGTNQIRGKDATTTEKGMVTTTGQDLRGTKTLEGSFTSRADALHGSGFGIEALTPNWTGSLDVDDAGAHLGTIVRANAPGLTTMEAFLLPQSQEFMIRGSSGAPKFVVIDGFAVKHVGVSGVTAGGDTVTGGIITQLGAAATGVSCRVYHSVAQLINNVTFTNPTFDSELWDTDNFHDPLVNANRLTIPAGKGGTYVVFASIHWDSPGATTTTFEVYIERNGGNGLANAKRHATGDNSQVLSGIDQVVPGDWFNLNVYQNSGGPLNIMGGSVFCTFGCVRISA